MTDIPTLKWSRVKDEEGRVGYYSTTLPSGEEAHILSPPWWEDYKSWSFVIPSLPWIPALGFSAGRGWNNPKNRVTGKRHPPLASGSTLREAKQRAEEIIHGLSILFKEA